MSELRYGHVKWFRFDGAGYIIPQENPLKSILIGHSSITLEKGQKVRFRTLLILGKEIAIDIQKLT